MNILLLKSRYMPLLKDVLKIFWCQNMLVIVICLWKGFWSKIFSLLNGLIYYLYYFVHQLFVISDSFPSCIDSLPHRSILHIWDADINWTTDRHLIQSDSSEAHINAITHAQYRSIVLIKGQPEYATLYFNQKTWLVIYMQYNWRSNTRFPKIIFYI